MTRSINEEKFRLNHVYANGRQEMVLLRFFLFFATVVGTRKHPWSGYENPRYFTESCNWRSWFVLVNFSQIKVTMFLKVKMTDKLSFQVQTEIWTFAASLVLVSEWWVDSDTLCMIELGNILLTVPCRCFSGHGRVSADRQSARSPGHQSGEKSKIESLVILKYHSNTNILVCYST